MVTKNLKKLRSIRRGIIAARAHVQVAVFVRDSPNMTPEQAKLLGTMTGLSTPSNDKLAADAYVRYMEKYTKRLQMTSTRDKIRKLLDNTPTSRPRKAVRNGYDH